MALITISLPFNVQHHLMYAERYTRSNFGIPEEKIDVMLATSLLSDASSVPSTFLGVWQGPKAFRVILGQPTSKIEDLSIGPVGASVSVFKLLKTGPATLSFGEAYNIGRDEYSKCLTQVDRAAAEFIPSITPSQFLTRQVGDFEFQIPAEVVATEAEKGNDIPRSFFISQSVVRENLLGKAGPLMAYLNSVMKLGDIKTRNPKPMNYNYGLVVERSVTMAGSMAGTMQLTYDTTTATTTWGLVVADDSWEQDVKLINDKMIRDVQLVLKGEIVGREVVRPLRPPSTEADSVKDKLDQWWADVMLVYDDLAASQIPKSAARQAADTAGQTSQQYAGNVATTSANSGSSGWRDIWNSAKDSLGGAASAVWGTVTEWGPTELLMGYAGYTAIGSAKKSRLPVWLIIGGVGLAALAIFKK